jgi:hypothetical protein
VKSCKTLRMSFSAEELRGGLPIRVAPGHLTSFKRLQELRQHPQGSSHFELLPKTAQSPLQYKLLTLVASEGCVGFAPAGGPLADLPAIAASFALMTASERRATADRRFLHHDKARPLSRRNAKASAFATSSRDGRKRSAVAVACSLSSVIRRSLAVRSEREQERIAVENRPEMWSRASTKPPLSQC